MKKKNPKIHLGAVIDIGSNAIRLKIGQNIKGELKIIENIDYPLSLGRDTFNNGKVSFEKADKTADILRNYTALTSEYGVEETRVIATSAVREAQNKDYILDQIRLTTGLNVKVIDNLDEKYYIYKMMLSVLPKEYKQSAMMVYIGSGNIGLTYMENEKIPFMENIKVGALRISELFDNLTEHTKEFYLVVEEYISTYTESVYKSIPSKPKHFIASGSEISLISKLCRSEEKEGFNVINKSTFINLYEEIKDKTVESLEEDYDLTNDQAELLLPAMCIFNNLLKLTKADAILAPKVLLIDSVLKEMLYPDIFNELNKNFYKNTVFSATQVAKKFNCDEPHFTRVSKYALKIFDKIKKLHGMSVKEKLLLQTAAILHDCGKFVNVRSHYVHAYNIIRSLDIVGLNIRDLEIIACVALYHSRIIPDNHDKIFMDLSESDRVITAKLASILRLSEALDRSHKEKFGDIEVNINDNTLMITVNTEQNIVLEEWSFNDKGLFFEDVFGLKTKLKKRKGI